ncbi:MAG: uncharacterized coiled-coil DUF342 family protein [Candidatus Woesearchaeota archaeon]|jgi:uncharacterized coiled-coil DUF342 family protein
MTEDVKANISNLKQEISDLNTQKEEWFEKKKLVSQQIAERINKIKQHKEARDKLTASVHEHKKKRDELNKKIKDQIAELRAKYPAPAPSKDRKRPAGIIKKEIKALLFKVETEGMSFDKEQKVMKIVKEKNKELKQAGGQTQFDTKGKELSKLTDELKKESDAVHDVIQSSAKQSQTEHDAILALSTEIDALREQEKEASEKSAGLKGIYKNKSGELSKIYDDNKGNMDADRETKRYERTARDERARAVEKERIEEQVGKVEEKIKKRVKLTTEDLLVFQRKSADPEPVEKKDGE